MWVCHCRAVSDAKVLQAIAEGAEDESDIGRLCGAGTGCGSCHDELRRLCASSRGAVAVPVDVPAPDDRRLLPV
jgi:bacterioferritin-associated ferredoxin